VNVAPPAKASTSSSRRSRPRYATPRDPDRPTRGLSTVAHLARLRSAPPFPWQWEVADVAGEINDTGDGFHHPIVVVSVPRRAGKTALELAVALDRMDIGRDVRAWYTAQRREDAAKQFRDEWAPMLERPSLRRLYKLRRSQGSEGIHKRHGSSRLQLFPPTENALHGMNADLVEIDEAWYFDQATGEALEAGVRAAQLTRSWRQLWIVSAGGTIESTWWDWWLTVGEEGGPGVALFDYGADSSADDYDPADPRTWVQAHPSLGRNFPIEALAHEWHTKRDVASFERHYLNVWPRPSLIVAGAGLELEQWATAAHPRTVPAPVTAIALDVAADRAWASIAVAGPAADRFAVEVVDRRPGVAWVADGIRAVRAAHRGVPVVADALVAASIVAELTRGRIAVEAVGAADHAKACGTFVDLLASGRLAHRSQRVLDDAVAGAARRPLGDAWLWSRSRSDVDISPLVAVTLAAWRAHNAPPPGRGTVVTTVHSDPQRIARTRHTPAPRETQHRATWRL
jgi:hypothetical protein